MASQNAARAESPTISSILDGADQIFKKVRMKPADQQQLSQQQSMQQPQQHQLTAASVRQSRFLSSLGGQCGSSVATSAALLYKVLTVTEIRGLQNTENGDLKLVQPS